METDFASMQQSDDRVNRQKLINDLKVVVQDAEELMRATATDLGEKAREARVKLAATLESAKTTCRRLEEKTVATAKAADRVIRDHPYQSVGLAFGVGLLVGVLVNRK